MIGWGVLRLLLRRKDEGVGFLPVRRLFLCACGVGLSLIC
jgi:hypothetical protein